MKDPECVAFLQWAIPRLRMRWRGFRKVRRQVCKRVERRLRELGVGGTEAYRAYLAAHPDEWRVLDSLCRIPISSFYRDKGVFDYLGEHVLPSLAQMAVARPRRELRFWSAGCASGEEPYTLGILWKLGWASRFPALSVRVIATDLDPHLLGRARQACYRPSSLRDVPPDWIPTVFERSGDQYCIRESFRQGVDFLRQDIRYEYPEGPFHLLLCRNLAFTYFDETLQRDVLERTLGRLVPGGAFVIGRQETLPGVETGLSVWCSPLGVYRKLGAS
ncbi:MAG: CheR family methyltransferase [Acidobacteriota bacterium]